MCRIPVYHCKLLSRLLSVVVAVVVATIALLNNLSTVLLKIYKDSLYSVLVAQHKLTGREKGASYNSSNRAGGALLRGTVYKV